jgi:nicotinate-nucleotide pyrophosphorylase
MEITRKQCEAKEALRIQELKRKKDQIMLDRLKETEVKNFLNLIYGNALQCALFEMTYIEF